MQEHYAVVTNAKYTNPDQTIIDATLDGKSYSGISMAKKTIPAFSYVNVITPAQPEREVNGEVIPAVEEVTETINVPEREEWLCRFAKDIQKHLDDGGTVTVYSAPPEPTILELLAKSDAELLKMVARSVEDVLDERVTDGKFVSQSVQDKISERKALRAQL